MMSEGFGIRDIIQASPTGSVPMKAFDLDRKVVQAYDAFSRSFNSIRAADLRRGVEAQYQAGRFWPSPLLTINPRYAVGESVAGLAATGMLHPDTASVFRSGEAPFTFHLHQAEAIATARARQSFVVTTGTGSGKSLCFFVPIIDRAIRDRAAGDRARTRAIVVYPMNALANSQIEEIDKFLEQAGLPEKLRPRVRRYTGQESEEERAEIATNPPDILLTNFMMLELLLTRQDDKDARVIGNATGLDFIVLDELHTYRGRQGSDVAVLMRRLQQRCCPDRAPLCIGTSATMSSEGTEAEQKAVVAGVASHLFGAAIRPDAVIGETLRRATDPVLSLASVLPALRGIDPATCLDTADDETLRRHPLAVWIEMRLGLTDDPVLRRRPGIALDEAAADLAQITGLSPAAAETLLDDALTLMSRPESERGGSGGQAFLAFKLHRFLSGSGEVFTTLGAPDRPVHLEGQTHDPDDDSARLYPTRFCRNAACGQEYHVVRFETSPQGRIALPRPIDETPIPAPIAEQPSGYLTPADTEGMDFDADSPETYPEDWRELNGERWRLKPSTRDRRPYLVHLRKDGAEGSDGRPFWFLPGKFAFCLACGNLPTTQERERTKLGGLSAEGRSSATTLLTSTALDWLEDPANGIAEDKRKILGFTDNRQDAALQAGHFNDFHFVTQIRAALLGAVTDAGEAGLSPSEFGLRVARRLRLAATEAPTRQFWMQNPDGNASQRMAAETTLHKVLAQRVWSDLRRGWRFTNPNLTTLNLIAPSWPGLEELAGDAAKISAAAPVLAGLTEATRLDALRRILTAMLEGLAVETEALDAPLFGIAAQDSRTQLLSPWSFDERVTPRSHAILVTARGVAEEGVVKAGVQSRLYKDLNKVSVLGQRLKPDDYIATIDGLLDLLEREGYVRPASTAGDVRGWRLEPTMLRLVPGPAVSDAGLRGNAYFHGLYTGLADRMRSEAPAILGREGREHTAQVDQDRREWREWRFRYGTKEKGQIADRRAEFRDKGESELRLPALFCSPTMELGVDISELNTVYLRNVPPTPANYAQRAGRAGRSGQAAAIITYCAAQSPHDQYYFNGRRDQMVSGVVRAPALDLMNQHLLRAHLQATWMATIGLKLPADIPRILDLSDPGFPLRPELQAVIRTAPRADAAVAMRAVLDAVLATAEGPRPGWLADPSAFVAETLDAAGDNLDRAFDRWRDLYRSAADQRDAANERAQRAGLSKVDRQAAQADWNQANQQIGVLEQGQGKSGSDFYSYRYLATEGFLPGYNFPRMPLYAFIPAGGAQSRGAFLSRARFLAISEFGPRSLIYHEGRAFRVEMVKLTADARRADDQQLTTRTLVICDQCGGAHDAAAKANRCHACDAPLASGLLIPATFRIDNVETQPVERITANDEERVRQGFDVQTVFAWPVRKGRLDIVAAAQGGGEVLLQYGEGAEISRVNKGLRRRKTESDMGFWINPRSGRWSKLDDEETEATGRPDRTPPQKIVPIVRDDKNALLMKFREPPAPETHATLQTALLRGIDATFQLEEGEILAEPLPSRSDRRTILAYEAAEGGAGVLTTLATDPGALAEVARRALEIMHHTPESVLAAIGADDPAFLVDEGDAPCVHGCYRCLLSYYNQPDHLLIDRKDPDALARLVRMAGGKTVATAVAAAPAAPASADGAAMADGWHKAFADAGLPAPSGPGRLGEVDIPWLWKDHYVAAASEPLPPGSAEAADALGWTLVALPKAPPVPQSLIDLLKE